MTTIDQQTRLTPEDLLAMPDGDSYELVNGELVERKMGWNSGWIGGQLHLLLGIFCRANPIAAVAPADSSYQCFANAPGKVRKPDVSVIRMERLPLAEQREGHCRIVPDLVAEVVSPNDLYSEVEEKVAEYLEAGVRLVWVLNPRTRSVRVHRSGGIVSDLQERDSLSGEGLLPGFQCLVSELFAVPPGQSQPAN